MFDIGWTEMMVVAVVAILFVGPKELPGMLRAFGRAVKKLRSMAGDFQKQFDDALKEAELDEVKNTLNDVRNLNPASKIKDHLNPIKEDLQDARKLVEDAADFDPDKDFDESKLPEPPKPVEVDVEAALERQRKANEVEKAELAAEAKARKPSKAPAKKAAAKKTAEKKTSAKKSTANTAHPVQPKTKTSAAAAKAENPGKKRTGAAKPLANSASARPKATGTRSPEVKERPKQTAARKSKAAKAGA